MSLRSFRSDCLAAPALDGIFKHGGVNYEAAASQLEQLVPHTLAMVFTSPDEPEEGVEVSETDEFTAEVARFRYKADRALQGDYWFYRANCGAIQFIIITQHPHQLVDVAIAHEGDWRQ
jgi:hypothetical protein